MQPLLHALVFPFDREHTKHFRVHAVVACAEPLVLCTAVFEIGAADREVGQNSLCHAPGGVLHL
eukprot:1064923-Amphidinium_carterae.1